MKYIRKAQNKKALADITRNKKYVYVECPAPSSFDPVRMDTFDKYPTEMEVNGQSPELICITYASAWKYFKRYYGSSKYYYQEYEPTSQELNAFQYVDSESYDRNVFDEVPTYVSAMSPMYILVGSVYYRRTDVETLVNAINYPVNDSECVMVVSGPTLTSAGDFSNEFVDYDGASGTAHTEGFKIRKSVTAWDSSYIGTSAPSGQTFDESNTYSEVPYPVVEEDPQYFRVASTAYYDSSTGSKSVVTYKYYTKKAK